MSKNQNKDNKAKATQPEINDAEILDNAPEAAEENETAEDIVNDEMAQIDALCKQRGKRKG